MTIRHMKIFRALCENDCNTTRAAEQLHMTQPAVSLAIRELEQYYGAKLFDRFGRRLHITGAGQRFYEYSLHISDLFEDMEKELWNWDSFGTLHVGASVTIGSQFLPGYVSAFMGLHPGAEVRALVAQSEQLEQKILSGELDLALIEGVAHDAAIESEPYLEDHLTVICPVGTFLPGQELTQEQFRSQRFLLREHGSGTREVFDRVTHSAGFSVTPIWEAMSTTALVNGVIHGLGVAVVPHRMVTGPLERGLVSAVTVEGMDFRRSFRIIRHREKYLTAAAKAFMELCRNYEMDYPLPMYNGLY